MFENSYWWLRLLHVTFVSISLILFFVRAVMTLKRLHWQLLWPKLRIIPHINDTLLFISGFTLAYLSHTSLIHGWLSFKLLLLLFYILAGIYTLKIANTRAKRLTGMTIAILTVAWMVKIALTKQIF